MFWRWLFCLLEACVKKCKDCTRLYSLKDKCPKNILPEFRFDSLHGYHEWIFRRNVIELDLNKHLRFFCCSVYIYMCSCTHCKPKGTIRPRCRFFAFRGPWKDVVYKTNGDCFKTSKNNGNNRRERQKSSVILESMTVFTCVSNESKKQEFLC